MTAPSRTLALLLGLAFICLSGCSGDNGSSPPVDGDTAVADVTPPVDADPGDADSGPSDTPTPGDLPDDVPDPPPPTTTVATPGAICPVGQRVAMVAVSRLSTQIYAAAVVWDRTHPWYGEPKLTSEACRFHHFLPGGACSPCDGDDICGIDGECTPAPTLVEDATFVLSAGGQEQTFEPHPVIGNLEGAVTLPGDTFSVTVTGRGQIVTLAETAIPNELGGVTGTLGGSYDAPESLDISWEPPGGDSQVFTNIPINHHAAGPTFTECLVDSALGDLHVDGDMLKPLAIATGLEFQGIEHVRVAAAQTPNGCFEFRFGMRQTVDLGY